MKLAADQKSVRSGNQTDAPPAVIAGRVADEDGDPWTHASVGVYRSEVGTRQADIWRWSTQPTSTSERELVPGRASSPGRYYLSADPDANWERQNRAGSAPHLQPTWYPSSMDSVSAIPVTLLAGQEITGLEIRLRRRDVHRIRGKVSGLQTIPVLQGWSPFTKPRLSVSPAGAGGVNRGTGAGMKEDGSFEVEGIAPGNYEIHVSEGFPQQITLGSTAVQIDDHDVEGVSLTVHAPQSLKGVIRTDADDKVVPSGISVWLDFMEGAGEEMAMVGKDGAFTFENVPSGRYRVEARSRTTSPYYVKHLRYGATESDAAAFTFAGSDDSLELILSARAPRVSGLVKRNGADESATPQVVLLPDTSDPELQRYGTQTGVLDQSGAFTFRDAVRPGDYTLYAFGGVPDGVWTDTEFIKAIEGKGVRIKVEEGDAKTVEVALIPRSDIAALLTRLGMD